jgi:hypothetical protein
VDCLIGGTPHASAAAAAVCYIGCSSVKPPSVLKDWSSSAGLQPPVLLAAAVVAAATVILAASLAEVVLLRYHASLSAGVSPAVLAMGPDMALNALI